MLNSMSKKHNHDQIKLNVINKQNKSNQMNTYCQYLWNGVTIDQKLNVYSCCLIKPGIIGNLNNMSFDKIINSEKAIYYRKQSLNGKLHCYSSCNLIDKSQLPPKNINPKIKSTQFKTLHIHFGNKCNINCIMCDHPKKFKENPIILNSKNLISKVDINKFQNIIVQGGEPLAIQECVEYLEYLASKNKKYILLTNGVLINQKMAKFIALSAKIVSISINAASKRTHEKVNKGSDFDTLLNNIQLLKHYKNKFNSQITINGRMTITNPAIEEIPLFLKNFEIYGFDTVNFGYVRETVPKFFKKYPKIRQKIQKEITNNLKQIDYSKVDFLRLIQLGLIEDNNNLFNKIGFLN